MKNAKIKKRLNSLITVIACTATAVQPALAQSIVADTGANAPTVLETANGIDMVMIGAANGSGVSLNTYQQFDVDENGAILNNIDGNFGMTNLGGLVQGNGNLSGGTATLIINQVTSPNPSELLGYLEVGGAQADVVIANAYGITCNGCGFINTDRVALTTGALTFNAVGALDTISVTDGAITIGAGGADATGVSQFDLISRQVNFAGSVQGQRVLVIAGQNDVIFSTGEVTENGGDGSASPEYAIDSTVFGGMYANKITIVSTEQGVGARAPERMSASSEGMTITADGRLVIGQASSQGSLTARSNSDSVVVRETIVSQEALTLDAKRDLILEADGIIVSEATANLIAEEGDLRLEAGAQIAAQTTLTLEAGDTLALADSAKALSVAGLGFDAQDVTLAEGAVLYAGGTLIGTADETLTNSGQIQAAGLMQLTAQDSLTNSGIINADNAVQLTSASLINSGTVDATGGALFLAGLSSFDNTGGTLSSDTGIQIELSGPQTLNATNWGTVLSQDWLTLQGANGGEIAALNVAADTDILANGQLIVKATDVVNAGTIASVDGNLLLQASADITNTGLVYAGGNLLAIRAGGTVLNDGGAILAASDMLICGVDTADCTQNLSADQADALINRTRVDGADYVPGVIETLNGDMILAANDIRNERVGTAEVTEGDRFDETYDRVGRDTCSTLFCAGDDSDDYYVEWTYKVTTTVDLEGPASNILSGGNLTLNAGTVQNDYSLISAVGDITFQAGEVINTGAQSGTENVRDRQDWYYDDNLGLNNSDYPVGPIVTTSTFDVDETFTGVIEAGGTISGTVVDAVINTSVNGNVQNLTAPVSDVTAPTAGDPSGITGNIDLSVLGNDQLFVSNPGADDGFVIETRPEFIDQDQFISSDYFLDTLGFDPDATQIRLGDPYAETYLIRNQITDLTGGRILNPELSEKEQIRLMYDNAVDVANALGLRPGVALTPEQIAALTTDIVWLEEQVIDGQAVLVPRVYLGASGGQGSRFDPARITATNITFNVGSLINSGAINAFDNLVVTAASDIQNLGGSMTAMDLLQLTSAQGDLLNLSGSITGGDVTIRANNILSETDIIRFTDGANVQEIAAPSALISATSGVLTLDAAGDITVVGGDLSGNAGVNILAGGDIDFAALELNSIYDGAGEDWSFSQTTNLSEVSTITSAEGGISIVSAQIGSDGGVTGGGNILFEGTQINALDVVDVNAIAGHVVIGAATDTSYTDLWYESDGLVFDSETRDERLTVTHQTAGISGSEINIYAAGTVFDQSSGLTATDGDLTIESATGDVQFGSLTEIDAHNRYTNSSAFGGLIEYSTETQSLLATALSTQADAQGDINLIVGGGLEFQGGSFTATGSINTQVAGDTRILATVDTDFSYVQELDNNSLLVVNTTKVDLQQTAGFTQFVAGNGVNLDETSTTTVGVVATQAALGTSAMDLVGVSDVSDPTQDMAITAFFLPDATGSPVDRLEDLTQDQLVNALVGVQNSESTAQGNDGDFNASGDANEAFDFASSTTTIDIPGAEDGAGYSYLDELQGRDNVTVQEIALIEHAYRDQNVEVGIVGKLLIAYVSGQIVGVFELGSIANAMATAGVSGTIEGVVTGNLDLETLATSVAFAGFTAGIGEIIPDIGFEQEYMNTGLLGERSQFTLGAVVNQAVETSVTAGMTTIVYGGDYADNFTSSLGSSVLTLATADVHTLVGDQYNLKDANGDPVGAGEGSLGHVLTHAVVGCGAAELQGGSCQTGAAAGIAQALYAGEFNGSSSGAGAASNDMAELLSGLAAAVVASGDGTAVTIAAGIGRSGFVNNRQLHAYDLADLVEALGGGAEALTLVENMTDAQIAQLDQELFSQESFEKMSPEQQRILAATCALIQCHLHVPQDDFLELGNDAFREELAKLGGGVDYLQDRQNLLDNRSNVDAFSYDVDDIYTDFELRTGRDIETDAVLLYGLDGLAALANFVDGSVAFADLLRRAENGDPDAIKERDEISARLNETLSNSDFIEAGFNSATDAMNAAVAEYNATIALLESAANGTFVDPDELRDAAFFKADFETKAAFGATAILTPTILARVGKFSGDTSVTTTNRNLLEGSPYTQTEYDAYVQRKLDAGETPRSAEDYVQQRQQLDQNVAEGARRQEEYRQEMADIYGKENVLTERYLRDADGDIVRDPDTGEARRLDCVVIDGQCGYAAEVTSPTADKDFQIAKEERIREEGGVYVENPNTGELIEVENTSEVIRLE